jgi:hypothetical protein
MSPGPQSIRGQVIGWARTEFPTRILSLAGFQAGHVGIPADVWSFHIAGLVEEGGAGYHPGAISLPHLGLLRYACNVTHAAAPPRLATWL